MKKTENIIITGATGMVGSEVLYQLLEDKLLNGRDCNIYLVIRPTKNKTTSERLANLLEYHQLPQRLSVFNTSTLINQIEILEGDVASIEIPKELGNNLTIIHLAACVNLGNYEKAKQQVISNNYEATISLIDKIKNRLKQFIYISTAFACGHREGFISNDYLQLDENTVQHRNHYEQYKLIMENKLEEYAQTYNFQLTIARPSIVCGRMLNAPKYFGSKYIVFYMFGKFFKDYISKQSNETFRLLVNAKSGMNVVPVDYVATAILRLIETNIKQINIVHKHNLPNEVLVGHIFKTSGMTNFEFVEEQPTKHLSLMEKIYYKYVGSQFSNYLTLPIHQYDNTAIRELMADIPEPNVTAHFDKIYNYAHYRDFKNQPAPLAMA